MTKVDIGTIVPRWEWRSFGQSFGLAEAQIKKHKCLKERESQETYILTRQLDVNIKIRNGLLDVKVLQEINRDRLELWTPTLKLEQPLDARELQELFRQVDVDLDLDANSAMNLDDLMRDIILPNPGLRCVSVEKKRYAYQIDGIQVELADLLIEAKPIRTLAIEDSDPMKLISLAKNMDLINIENINYIKVMHDMAGFED